MTSFVVRRFTLTVAAAAMAAGPIIGMATANADSYEVRSADRGQVSVHKGSVVRTVKIGAINGGQVSKGAPIVRDSYAATLPCVDTSHWATKGQDWAYNSNFAC